MRIYNWPSALELELKLFLLPVNFLPDIVPVWRRERELLSNLQVELDRNRRVIGDGFHWRMRMEEIGNICSSFPFEENFYKKVLQLQLNYSLQSDDFFHPLCPSSGMEI